MRTQTLIVALSSVAISASGCAAGGRAGLPSRWRTIASAGEKPAPIEAGPPGRAVIAELEEPEPRSRAEGRISGRVVDDRGRPVPNAEVRLADGSSRAGRDLGDTTDEAGGFTIKGLRAGGSYTLIAESDDGQGMVSGRIRATAPSTSVRIRLTDSESGAGSESVSEPPVRKRVGQVSEREAIEDEDGDAPTSRRTPPRVNEADLPPADEAEVVESPVEAAAQTTRKRPARSAWRSGGESDPAVEMADTSNDPLTRRRPAGEAPSPSSSTDADEGPNPLPPAKERPAETAAPQDPPTSPLAPPPAAEPKPVAPLAPASPETKPAETGQPPSDGGPGAPPIDAPNPPPASSEPSPAEAKPAHAPSQDEGHPASPSDLPTPPSDSPSAAPADAPGADKPINSVSLPAEVGPKRRPTWGEITEQNATRQVASALPISTRRPGSTAAVDSTPARSPRGLAGLIGGRARGPERPEGTPSAPVATCQFDAKKQRIVDFRLPDLDGQSVRFQDLDADYVLLDFWGTWCKPCRESIPHLVELQTRYGAKTLRVVGVATEHGASPEQQAKNVEAVSKQLGVNYPVLLSEADGQPCPLQQSLHIQAYPTMILLDRSGNILWRGTGAELPTLARLDRVIAARADSAVVRR